MKNSIHCIHFHTIITSLIQVWCCQMLIKNFMNFFGTLPHNYLWLSQFIHLILFSIQCKKLCNCKFSFIFSMNFPLTIFSLYQMPLLSSESNDVLLNISFFGKNFKLDSCTWWTLWFFYMEKFYKMTQNFFIKIS